MAVFVWHLWIIIDNLPSKLLHEKCDGHMISVFQYLTVSLSIIPDKIRPLYTVFSPLSPLLLDVNGSPPQYIANIPNSM